MANSIGARSDQRIDIVMPLFNKEEWIAGALDSILAQTLDDWSLTIVDDGSTDRSAEIARRYLTDDRIQLIRQENAGPGPARNLGARVGSAPLLGFLDADDSWLPGYLESTINTLVEHPESAMVATSAYLGSAWESRVPLDIQRGFVTGTWRCPVDLAAPAFKTFAGLFTPSGVVVRRSVFNEFDGYFSRWKCTYGEDSYLFIQILLHYPVQVLLEPLFWRNVEGSVLGVGRRTPYPIPPHLVHADEICGECPSTHREMFKDFLDWHTIWTARRLARQGKGRAARQLLKENLIIDPPKQYKADIRAVRRWALASPVFPPVRYIKRRLGR